MTSKQVAENRQDNGAASDNVHYVQWPIDRTRKARMYLYGLWTLDVPLVGHPSTLRRYAYSGLAMLAHVQSNLTNPHASPIMPSQVNQTPAMGISGDAEK